MKRVVTPACISLETTVCPSLPPVGQELGKCESAVCCGWDAERVKKKTNILSTLPNPNPGINSKCALILKEEKYHYMFSECSKCKIWQQSQTKVLSLVL